MFRRLLLLVVSELAVVVLLVGLRMLLAGLKRLVGSLVEPVCEAAWVSLPPPPP